MSIDFILPDIGEGIVECEIVEWLVAEGDVIEEDQGVVDVMTDKALVQIPAICAGTVIKLYYQKGDIANVHEPLFAITPSDSACRHDEIKKQETVSVNHDSVTQEVKPPVKNVDANISANITTNTSPNITTNINKKDKKALASPAVRRVARELGVNIHQVAGSGNKGRVYKEDVMRFSQDRHSQVNEGQVNEIQVNETQINQAQASQCEPNIRSETGGKHIEPIRGIKAAMAKAMVASATSIPHFTYCEEVDLTELILLRQQLKAQYAKQDVKLTLMPFFMKSMSMAMLEFPLMNSKVNEDCSEITYFNDHNIGMAVDSTAGLLVPNVKQVQTKSIVELALEIARLTEQARVGRVSRDDLTGGTISISNIGAIGGKVATPIINKPEVAIVALGKVQTLPRFNENGEVEARNIMQISWSGDHRVLDGGTIARFTNAWKALLENPNRMLVNLR